ncbi:MAG: 23S rRNA (pseudouridine(1915)-N(3))-methyltransferase RlmH [Bacilli bacterium]|nr:23S rRNA (pseudouridine(1915)-N(3))-methyltransferase RlmH [Bacilli bacterium]
MKIKILAVGKLKERYLVDACKEYIKRISRFSKVEVEEIEEIRLYKDSPSYIEKVIEEESLKIMNLLNSNDYNILLDVEGEKFSSIEFSQFLKKKMDEGNSSYTFIIGGSYGVSDKLRNIVNQKISLSTLTFPHQLARVIVFEQIYRCFKILNNEIYHK